MAVAGFYRRALPSPPAIDFSSPEGKKLFGEALQKGNMEGFFKLISYYQTQSEPAYCGLTTLAMVLNALAIDPCRKWKGPWRWFDETMLDCCEPLENIRDKGISFGKVVCLARCAGANVEAFRTDQCSIDEFRKYIMVCSTSDDCHVISSYSRRVFKQTGTGHFSPIGGYHAESDMVLILDVARFKYPPHWIPLSLLWEAMDTVVEATGLRRGFMLVSRQQRAPALLYALSCKHESWISTAKYLMDDVPVLLSSDNVKDIKHAILTVFSSLPSDFSEFIKWVVEVRRKEDVSQALSQEEKSKLAMKEEVLKLVQETVLYKHVTKTLSAENSFCTIEQTLSHINHLPNTGAGACCRETYAGSYKATNGDKHVTVASGTVANNTVEQGVASLVPLSQRELDSCTFGNSCGCSAIQPASTDVFTALLLALPLQTWSAIKDRKVLEEISIVVSIENLPSFLQDEILHMRDQLLLLKRCKGNRVEDCLDSPTI
ncbi:UNVERIFIED_CONTAM: Glutathione gamma-glutamylcysteinyltransferase 1 [Sesamum calycinum]|uniref:glutathione gamma-glutamylcysteinyltransferase n=1 Tax=Sesamum calycinum TaxID=2727403 RepID=A0AAW2R5Q9_9LAMI